ncbi:MAG: thioredoxin domain-containing protein, partial [Pseudomonadota bacterium]|nr:thioredoxin domain-containing protein [Pseudomonadota bacterium]
FVARSGFALAAIFTVATASQAQDATTPEAEAASFVPLASDGGLGTGVYENEAYEGSPDAPIVLIEYASLTCPHCAAFHREGYPLLKPFIEAGQLAYVHRDFPLDGVAYRAALAARCLQGQAYFAAIDALYENQRDWRGGGSEDELAVEISSLTGQSVEEYKACVGDQTNQQTIIERYNTAVEDLGVDGTPRIFINGDPFTPRGGWTEIEAEIERRVSRL